MENRKIPDNKIKIPIIPVFDPIEELNMYTSLGSLHTFIKGSKIISPGIPFYSIIYLISGQLEASIVSRTGEEKYLFEICKNCIGVAINPNDDHEFQITAVKDCIVYFFTLDMMVEILSQDANLLKKFILNIVQKVHYFEHQARDLYQCRSSSRVFSFLYDLCLTKGKRVNDHYELAVENISQKMIAKITGTHPVTVCKLFTYLSREGIIKKNKKVIKIYDLNKLCNLIADEELTY
ncbi:MAG: Crp/Fnr family transcriptional regulator [Dehalobacter sp. 4CP]|uniref:Crp/Fnr family transcriptional regulator n=1 Tax=unclassified Dehalobacter TaxID=2635733 RepID=UPI0013C813B2|nr:Crp/Fnr family transcriptional regulator [Dehalobacter sp. 4CP]